MKAFLKRSRISPKKANLVAALVRNKKIQEAVDILRFTPKKAAPILRKLIESAAANAETNFKQNKENLVISEIIVTEGPTYKRHIPISKGRVHPILKRTSHIRVLLSSAEAPEKAPEKTSEKAPKKEAATASTEHESEHVEKSDPANSKAK